MHIGDRQSQERLARAVKTRRAALKLRQQDLSERGGPSKATLYNIENAVVDTFSPPTIQMLEVSLDWAHGSVQSIVTGGEPEPLPVDPEEGDEVAQGDGIEIQYRGWRLTLHPRKDATREEIRQARRGVLNAVVDQLDSLDAEKSE
jgi:hypothetical protein